MSPTLHFFNFLFFHYSIFLFYYFLHSFIFIQDELETLATETRTNEANLYEEMQRLAMHASVLSTSVDLPLTSRLSNYVVEEEENAGTLNDGINEGIAAIIKALLASSDPTSQNFDLARFHYLSHVSKALVVAKHR